MLSKKVKKLRKNKKIVIFKFFLVIGQNEEGFHALVHGDFQVNDGGDIVLWQSELQSSNLEDHCLGLSNYMNDKNGIHLGVRLRAYARFT